jgi:hypothetical protein
MMHAKHLILYILLVAVAGLQNAAAMLAQGP